MEEPAKPKDDEYKKCPFCAELIKKEAKVCRYCGRDLSEKSTKVNAIKTKSKGKSRTIPIFILICIVLSFWIFTQVMGAYGRTHPSSQPAPIENKVEKPDVENEAGAEAMAEHFVKERLKAPRTAKFPWFDKSMVKQVDSSTWIVNSYVDSQNSFGAMIRTHYRAKVHYLGHDKWQLWDMKFSDE